MHFDQHIKDRLVARRRVLLDRYHDEISRADQVLDAPDVEPVGNAADCYDAHLLLVLGDADARALSEVAGAIERFDSGTYGRCVDCLRDIGARRIEALPAVALCIACAARAEQP